VISWCWLVAEITRALLKELEEEDRDRPLSGIINQRFQRCVGDRTAVLWR